MIPFLLFSVSASVTLSGCTNYVTKQLLPTKAHINAFNLLMYAVCVLGFLIMLLTGSVSWFTVALGLLYGIVTDLCSYYKLRALSTGPMHITTLFTTASLIIPTVAGVFFGETLSLPKMLFVGALLFFLYLSFEKKEGGKISWKWLAFTFLCFLFRGSVGILQKIHQTSIHKNEVGGLLFVSFCCACLFSLIRNKGVKASLLSKKAIGIALLCGVCTFIPNLINLRLAGMLPSQLFFPLVDGSVIIFSMLMSFIIFKEKLTKRQAVGLAGGIACLFGICLI